MMKKVSIPFLLFALLLGAPGCTDILDSNTDDQKLRFENASSYTVTVMPQTSEWGGVRIAPGERAVIGSVRDLDYVWHPPTRVVKGSASTDYDVIFVNAPPAGSSGG